MSLLLLLLSPFYAVSDGLTVVDRFSLYYFGFPNSSQVLRLQVCTTTPGSVFSVSYGMSCVGHHNKLCFEFLFLGFVFGMYLCVRVCICAVFVG